MTRKLTQPQIAALRLIADGGVRVHEFSIRHGRQVIAPKGQRIHHRTFEAVETARFVTRDSSTSLFDGQAAHITPAGRVALLHANCGRATCDDCGDTFDECEAKFRDEYDATLCGDCVDGRLTRDEDNAAWRSYAY